MSKISEIDKNFKVETPNTREDTVFLKATDPAFELNGIFYEDGKFRRMPEAVAKEVSWGVLGLSSHTAGGRLRFKTDSEYIIIKATLGDVGKMPHFALTGSAGFDLYEKCEGADQYYRTFVPAFDIEHNLDGMADFGSNKMREFTINFPLYSEVTELYIGLQNTATIEKPTPYTNEKPVVYYGSSITQGGCASRAGSSYEGFISRRLNLDYINLGFSGSAKGEDVMADYVAGLDMSAFVYDYDYNAPNAEHLKATHEKMFKKVRNAHPNIPIIMMSVPKYTLNADLEQRLAVIKETYNNAVNSGDKNVYLLTGPELMEPVKDEGLVDGCHPTDLGFSSMAKVLGDLLEKIL